MGSCAIMTGSEMVEFVAGMAGILALEVFCLLDFDSFEVGTQVKRLKKQKLKQNSKA